MDFMSFETQLSYPRLPGNPSCNARASNVTGLGKNCEKCRCSASKSENLGNDRKIK